MTGPLGQATAAVVLVIDDEDYVADMIASALDMEGYTVHVAYNGREGLHSAQSIRADLIVVDIMMPYISGEELIDLIRADGHHDATPIILISAGARPRRQWPDVTFIAKPFELNNLLDEAGAALARKR